MTTSPYQDPSSVPRSAGPVDEDAVRRAKSEIQALVQEVVELSRSEIEPAEFYSAMMDKSVAALAAVGGVVWTYEEGAGLNLEYQVNLQQTGLAESKESQTQHGRLLQQIIAKGESVLVPPHSGTGEDSGEEVAANPTDFLLVIAPIKSDRGVEGVVEIFQRPGARPTTQKGYLRFLGQICELAGEFIKSRRLRHFTTKQSLWEQLEAFTGLVHKALDSRETAYTIANEGRRLIGCDRVTVALSRGNGYRVEAISGQDTFDKRSNLVRLLQKLATTVARTGDDLWFDGDTSDLAPQVEQAVNEYVDEAHTKRIAVLPLREAESEADEKPGEKKEKKHENILGAIIIEQLVDSRQPDGMLQRIDVVRRHSSTSLTNAQEHENLFLLPLWRLLGKTRVLVTARNLPKTLLATVALVAAIFALCYVQYEFTVVADGKLLPEIRRDIFANIGGVVEEVAVNTGELVSEGQLLTRQWSVELEEQTIQLKGELDKAVEEIATVKRQRDVLKPGQSNEVDRAELTGRLAQLDESFKSLLEQDKLVQKKQEMLTTESPIAGKVVTWKLRERLENRPVQKGQQLLQIADPSSRWELEIYVPEAKMGHIVKQLETLRAENDAAELTVSFILATHSAVHLDGRVVEIDTSAEVHGEEGSTVRMRVSFAQEDLKQLVTDPAKELKVGADVKAKVRCGQRAIGYVWFHDLFEFVQSRILFRL